MRLAIASVGVPASAATFTLTGVVDARVRDVNNAPFLESGNEVFLSPVGFRTNTILEFDLSFVPAGEIIDGIFLTATDIAANNTLFVNGYSGNGTLETTDALESSDSLGTFAVAVGANGPFSLSTGFVNYLLGADADYLGLNIGVQNVQSGHSISNFTVQFNTVAAQIPLPASGLLLAGALGGIVAFIGGGPGPLVPSLRVLQPA